MYKLHFFLHVFAVLQKAKSKAHSSNNLKEEANLCNQLGEVYAKTGKTEREDLSRLNNTSVLMVNVLMSYPEGCKFNP